MVVYPEGVWYCGIKPEDVPEVVRTHFAEGNVVERLARLDNSELRAEILSNREKFLAAQRARQSSGALPDELQQTIRAFQESRVILTALELNVFTAVGRGAEAAEVAARVAADPRATEMLLNALVAMGLLFKLDARFKNTPDGERYFVDGSGTSAREGLMHTAHLWPRWSTLTECVRTGTAVQAQEVAERGREWTEAFIAAMHRIAAERAPLVVRAVGAERVRNMLDVGGGSGAYSIAFAGANRELRAEIFDLPAVVPIARAHVERAGLSGRVTTRSGDLRIDSFGEGYDLVFLSSICHMLDANENLDLLRRCRAAVGAEGRVVIQDFILNSGKTAPKSAALFSLNMLVGTRRGSSYSIDEYSAWLQDAGFKDIGHIRLPGPSGLVVGRA
jgi:hypothetical protein